MKTAFKASFYKALLKLKNPKLKSEIALIIFKIENAEDLRNRTLPGNGLDVIGKLAIFL